MDVTTSAAMLIGDHVRSRGDDNGGFRIRREGEEYGQLLIGYVVAPMPEDTVVNAGHARVFVAPDARESVDPFTLDVRKVNSQYHLYLRNRDGDA
jgi:hypothetical protein